MAIIFPADPDLIDVAGPACVFSSAARCLMNAGASAEPVYAMDYLSLPGGLIDTRQGLMLNTHPLHGANAADYDTVIVTGGEQDAASGADDIAHWLASARPLARRIASVCTGAFFLARAGLLDGKCATTHWMDCGQLARQFHSISVDSDAIFVEDGGAWTSAGATAGIDMALAMVEQDYGHDLAMMVARMQVVFLKRHGGIENAKRLLSQTRGEAGQIAFESGFGSYERMRRTFIRRLGISPLTYRKRFGWPEKRLDNGVDLDLLAYQANLTPASVSVL